MILPPFFGLYSKYNERTIESSLISYLATDIALYTNPTPNIIVSYKNLDILSYNKLFPLINISYLTSDILNISTKNKESISLSFLGCDILSYEFPFTLPSAINFFSARDKDSLGVLTWDEPFDGKTRIIRYDLQYKKIDDDNWTMVYSNITGLSFNLSIQNNFEYLFKIAPVNALGTGEYTFSNTIIPSGGIDNICDVVSYVGFNIFDLTQEISRSCFSNQTVKVTAGGVSSIEGVNNSLAAYFPALSFTINTPPHINQVSFPHIHIPAFNSGDWSLINNFTISFYFKPDDNPSFTRTILSSTSNISNKSWKISYTNNSIFFSSGTINSMQNIIFSNNLNVSTNNFTHVAICRSNNYISLFINGEEKKEIFNSNNIDIDSDYLIVGAYATNYNYSTNNNWGIVVEPFKGAIDEILISRSALYRGNFNVPVINRNITSTDCDICFKIEDPPEDYYYYYYYYDYIQDVSNLSIIP
jgi:hypothetical protein